MTDTEKVQTVAVIGFGTMGTGIVQSFAEAGLTVRAVDQTAEALDKGRAQLAASLAFFQAEGLIDDAGAVLDLGFDLCVR